MADSDWMLAFDIGSTRLKAGLFDVEGKISRIAARPLPMQMVNETRWVDPDQLVGAISSLLKEILNELDPNCVRGIGICSMAESGLLINTRNQTPTTWMIPWFDRSDESQVKLIREKSHEEEVFSWSGIRATYKCPLARILWLQKEESISLENKIWLSAADFLAFTLTGQTATDYSLATRTLAYDINQKRWHQSWLQNWGMKESLFPAVIPAGKPVGVTKASCLQSMGLPAGIPVSIAGHDHVCAAAALSALSTDSLVDSMGTAETLVGALPDRPLGKREYLSGLSYGVHVLPGLKYGMGALSTSGGALEWMRAIFAPQMTYDEIEKAVMTLPAQPGELVFIPYLSGSGAPHSNPSAAGAWIGLKSEHTRAHMIKAVMEGAVCEMEFVRRTIVTAGLLSSERIIVTGGGALNRSWLKIKADVTGCVLSVSPSSEAALIGAAMAAGIACNLFDDFQSAAKTLSPIGGEMIQPDKVSSPEYHDYYEQRYLPAMQLIQQYPATTLKRE